MDNAQELIQRLNQSGKKLSKSHRRIAECIVSHYDKAAFMTASRLGEYVGVSESTVVRFASALGYDGYPQLQRALQELIRHRLTASQRFEMTSDIKEEEVLQTVLKADMLNIRHTVDQMDQAAFDAAVKRLDVHADAPRVRQCADRQTVAVGKRYKAVVIGPTRRTALGTDKARQRLVPHKREIAKIVNGDASQLGTTWVADMSNGYVGIGYGEEGATQQIPDEIKAQVEEIRAKIVSGEIKVDTTRN